MKTLYWTYGSIVASFVLLLGIWGITGTPRWEEFPQAKPDVLSFAEDTALPAPAAGGRAAVYEAVASLNDIARYRAIARLSHEKKWDDVDAIMAKVENRALIGHFLAARYTDKNYTPSLLQLKLWLTNNSHLPQAGAVLQVMRKYYPKEAAKVSLPAPRHTLNGFSDSSLAVLSLRPQETGLWKSGFSSLGDGDYNAAYQMGVRILRQSHGESQHGNWLAGLAAWRLKDIGAAARHFAAMAHSEQVATPYRAAAAFWSYRAYKLLGNERLAQEFLKQAASAPQSFYGLIATAELGQPIWRPQESGVTQRAGWQRFVQRTPIEQIVLLNAINENSAAERLMRHSYFNFRREDREKLTELAHTLGMASVVLPMARYAGSAEPAVQAALYPVPEWRDRLALSTDHALVLAIVKQESGFNPKVSSPQGAQGLMQILPSTAEYMRRQKGALEIETAAIGTAGLEALPRSWSLLDPSYNLAIGQAYLRYLSAKPYIHGNLVYLLVGYNAGVVALLRWQDKMGEEDPLLFMECIPYAETRHYVKNVLRNYWIYRGLLEGESSPTSLTHLVGGQWPVS